MRLFVVEFERERKREFSEKVTGDDLVRLFEGTGFAAKADFDLDAVVEKIDTTFQVGAHIHGVVEFECGKCLERSQLPVDVDASWVLMTQAAWTKRYGDEEEIELNEEDLDVSFYEGDEIDLLPLIREAVLLELPTYPVCATRVDECEEAYRRNIGEKAIEEIEESSMDLRWGPLRDIKLKD